MAIVSLHQCTFGYGGIHLLENATLSIEPGERIALLGRNGQGKSTLFNIISGKLTPDEGELIIEPGCTVSLLPQEVPAADERTVRYHVTHGLGAIGEKLWAYDQAVAKGDGDAMERLQDAISNADAWTLHGDIDAVLNRFDLDGDAPFSTLSAGWRRRATLARAVVTKPDLLLLDEPTNHLDIASILWLEEYLQGFAGAVMLITHDRSFMERVGKRILDLDRGVLSSWHCSYYQFLERREHQLEVEEKQHEDFDKKLAQEEVWIRKGVQARRTRNEGRVRALKKMRLERAQRRERSGSVRLEMQEGEQSGKLICNLKDISYTYPGTEVPIITKLSTRIMRGDRLGIIGNNGTGKTTLIKLLLGELKADSGEHRMGTNIQTVYFDQNQAELDPDATLRDVVAAGGDWVEINGRKLHYKGYLKRFLFTDEHQRATVKTLSGGERNRLLLAQLFTWPCNVLIMDEPTNDLDMETLELLEDLVENFPGTLILVSHDRAFVNNTVSSVLLLEGDGLVYEYVGGYDDALEQHQPVIDARTKLIDKPKKKAEAPAAEPANEAKAETAPKKKRLSYMAQREYDALPEKIEALETEQTALTKRIEDPALYEGDRAELEEVTTRLETVSAELDQAYDRWAELEEEAGG